MEGIYKAAAKFAKPSAGKQMVTDYKEKLISEAEEIVLTIFPQKIIELDQLVNSDKFKLPDLAAIHVVLNIPIPDPVVVNECQENADAGAPNKKRKLEVVSDTSLNASESDIIINGVKVRGTKVMAFTGGVVEINKGIAELCDIVKPHIRTLVEHTNKLKMWIQFLIPRIEDGNNFGVSIQEDTLGEVRTVETEAATFFDQISRYFTSRGSIIAKIAKYPHVQDYRRAIDELDEKQLLSLRLVLCELRNHYALLHDLITKNLEKIKKPRSSNTDSMY